MGIARKLNWIKLPVLVILVWLVKDATAQTASQIIEQEKYWNYRERFKKTHINIDKSEGNTLPITNRFNYTVARINNNNKVQPCHKTSNDRVMIEWSDNALIDLGKYIAVLSSEINLLIRNEQDYSEPMRELYYALLTYNRLDEKSDVYLDPDLTNNLDGRLMRDDITFETSENWENYDSCMFINAKARGSFKKYRSPPEDCNPFTYNISNIMSKDDVIGMLFGLAFVKKFVPNDYVTDGLGQNGMYIVSEAQAIAHRIMNYVSIPQEFPKECGLYNWEVTMRENWTIIYPEINHLGYNTIKKQDGVFGIDFFAEIAPAVVQLGNYITGHTYSYLKIKDRNLIPSATPINLFCWDYQSTRDPSNRYNHIIRVLRNDDRGIVGTILSGSPLGWLILGDDESARVSAHLNLQAGLIGPLSYSNALRISHRFKSDHLYDLAYALFRNEQPSQPEQYWADILANAPVCENIGSYNGTGKWNNRYFGRDLFGPDHFDYEGERNGLDYMLLYNLYHIQYGSGRSYNKSACDCKPSSILFETPTSILPNTTVSKGKTHILSSTTYHLNGITMESFIKTPISIQSNAILELLEFVAFCTPANGTFNSLQNQGTLLIGNVTDRGNVSFKPNTQLVNQSGGLIKVTPGSALTISKASQFYNHTGATIILEDGAKLIVENGGELILSGDVQIANNAKIIIHNGGKLICNSTGSILSSSTQPSIHLSGKIVLHRVFSADDFGSIEFSRRFNEQPEIIVSHGAKFELPSSSNTLIRLVGLNAADLMIRTEGNGEVNFLGGKVELSKDSRLFIHGNTQFFNVDFVSTNSTLLTRTNGIVVTPTNPLFVRFCKFIGLGKALTLNLSLTSQIATVEHCQFNSFVKGLSVTNKGIHLRNSSFGNFSSTAVITEGINMPSRIESSTISYGNTGVLNQGANYQGVLTIENSSFSHLNYGIQNNQGRTVVKNCNLLSNEVGLFAETGTIDLSCSSVDHCLIGVLISENGRFKTNFSARNVISNSEVGVVYDKGNAQLNGGENWFDNNLLNFYGEVKPSTSLLDKSLSSISGIYNYYDLYITRNIISSSQYPYVFNNILYGTYGLTPMIWTPTFQIQPNQTISIPDPFNYRDVYPSCINCNLSYIPCPTGGLTQTPYGHIDELTPGAVSTNTFVNNVYFSNVELKEAIRTAANNMSLELESPNNDSLAVAMLSSLLSTPGLFDNSSSKQLLKYCHQLMTTSISNAYHLGVLSVSNSGSTSPLNATTATLINSIDQYISTLMLPEHNQEVANKLVDIAMLYRISGHYESALDYLNDGRTDVLSKEYIDYWRCIVENEWDFIQGDKSIEEFLTATEECSSNSGLRKGGLNVEEIRARINAMVKTRADFVVFPNPTSGYSTLMLPNSDLRLKKVLILDMRGSVVRSLEDISHFQGALDLDLIGLLDGIYVVQIFDDLGNRHNLKLLKRSE